MQSHSMFGSENHGVQVGTYVDLNGRDFGIPPNLRMVAYPSARKA